MKENLTTGMDAVSFARPGGVRGGDPWSEADHLYGIKLAQFMTDRGCFDDIADPVLTRTIRRWRKQYRVNVWEADKWLIRAGYTLAELPDDLFEMNALDPLLKRGMNNKAIARAADVSPSTVRRRRQTLVDAGIIPSAPVSAGTVQAVAPTSESSLVLTGGADFSIWKAATK